jgi:hypothetical protein
MTMNEAIDAAQSEGGAYIARFADGWRILGRTPRCVRGLIYVTFDGATFRV